MACVANDSVGFREFTSALNGFVPITFESIDAPRAVSAFRNSLLLILAPWLTLSKQISRLLRFAFSKQIPRLQRFAFSERIPRL